MRQQTAEETFPPSHIALLGDKGNSSSTKQYVFAIFASHKLRCIVTRVFPDGQRDLVQMEITKLILHLEVSLSGTLYIQGFSTNYFLTG